MATTHKLLLDSRNLLVERVLLGIVRRFVGLGEGRALGAGADSGRRRGGCGVLGRGAVGLAVGLEGRGGGRHDGEKRRRTGFGRVESGGK
jgi:hypothetical protein